MLLTHHETLSDKIIRILLVRQQTAKELQLAVSRSDDPYTIQALYSVLRQLMGAEVILKRGKQYLLNEEWRTKVVAELNKDSSLQLSEGESVSYTLASLVHHDLQWKNVVLPLHRAFPSDPIFFYSYHYIWVHLGENRHQSEKNYFAQLSNQKIPTFSLTGSDSKHDTMVKQELQNEYVQWAVGVEQFSKTDYVTVFNDFIVTTRLTKQLADKIERCYRMSPDTKTLEMKLHKLDIGKRKIRLIVERNRNKAKKVRKRLSREFFVPKDLIEKFQLY